MIIAGILLMNWIIRIMMKIIDVSSSKTCFHPLMGIIHATKTPLMETYRVVTDLHQNPCRKSTMRSRVIVEKVPTKVLAIILSKYLLRSLRRDLLKGMRTESL